MSDMDAKSYLQQLKDLNDLIDDKQEEMDMLYARLTKITPTLQLVAVSGGGNKDSLGNGVSKLIALREEINSEIDRYVDLKKEINSLIENIKNSKYRTLLRKRYVLFKAWEQIACEMDCSYQWVITIHGRALEVVEKMISSEKRVYKS
jgi:hypothetical protein